MTAKEYLKELKKALGGVPLKERREVALYFKELIDEEIASGKSEQEAVSVLESPQSVAQSFLPKAQKPAGARIMPLIGNGVSVFVLSLLAFAFAAGAFAAACICVALILSAAVLFFNGIAALGFSQIGLGLAFGALTSVFAGLGAIMLKLVSAQLRSDNFAPPAFRWKTFALDAAVIFIGATLFASTVGSGGQSPAGEKFLVEKTRSFSAEEPLKLTADNIDLKIALGEGDAFGFVYFEDDRFSKAVNYSSGELSIDDGGFLSKLSMFFIRGLCLFGNEDKLKSASLTIPADYPGRLMLELGTATVKIDGGSYGEIDMEIGSGEVMIKGALIDKFEAEIQNGKILLDGVTSDSQSLGVKNGKIEISGGKSGKTGAQIGTGAVEFDGAYADEMDVKIRNGAVRGQLAGILDEFSVNVCLGDGDTNLESKQGGKRKLDLSVDRGEIYVDFQTVVEPTDRFFDTRSPGDEFNTFETSSDDEEQTDSEDQR